MLGRIVLGTANDRVGGKSALMFCVITMLCGLIWLQMARHGWMLFLFAAINGFAHGGFFTVVSPTVAEMFGTRSHGVLFGSILFMGTIGGAMGPIMTGRIYDVTGSYRTAFLVLTGMAILGLVLIARIRPLRGTEIGKEN